MVRQIHHLDSFNAHLDRVIDGHPATQQANANSKSEDALIVPSHASMVHCSTNRRETMLYRNFIDGTPDCAAAYIPGFLSRANMHTIKTTRQVYKNPFLNRGCFKGIVPTAMDGDGKVIEHI